MTTLPLPALVGTRNRARALVEDLPADLSQAEVIVDGTDLLASTVSFADELLKQLLGVRRAGRVTIANVSDEEFVTRILERAEANGYSERVAVRKRGLTSFAM